MKAIQRTLKILAVRVVGDFVYLDVSVNKPSLVPQSPKIPRPESVIEPMPKTDAERVARETARAMVDEFKRQGIPTSMLQGDIATRLPIPTLSLTLTLEEYEKLGKPTVVDELKMKIEVES